MATRLQRSRTVDRLVGTEFRDKTIKNIHKHPTNSNLRIITTSSGERINTTKKVVNSLMEVQVDLSYRRRAQARIVEKSDGTVTTVLGGPKEGEIRAYASRANALKGIKNYYHADFDKYQKNEKAKSCRRREKKK